MRGSFSPKQQQRLALTVFPPLVHKNLRAIEI